MHSTKAHQYGYVVLDKGTCGFLKQLENSETWSVTSSSDHPSILRSLRGKRMRVICVEVDDQDSDRLELIELIREFNPNSRVFAVTGSNPSADVEIAARAAGASAFFHADDNQAFDAALATCLPRSRDPRERDLRERELDSVFAAAPRLIGVN